MSNCVVGSDRGGTPEPDFSSGPRGVGIAIIKYAVKFMHPLTGHKIDVFVDLTREQEADVRGQRHASPDHPLAKRYAIENAVKRAPRGYILVQGENSLARFASMILNERCNETGGFFGNASR